MESFDASYDCEKELRDSIKRGKGWREYPWVSEVWRAGCSRACRGMRLFREWSHDKVKPWFRRQTWALMMNKKVDARRRKAVPSLVTFAILFLLSAYILLYSLLFSHLDDKTLTMAEEIVEGRQNFDFQPWPSSSQSKKGFAVHSLNFDAQEITNGSFSLDRWDPLSARVKTEYLVSSMKRLMKRESLDCLCARELGVQKKLLLVSREDGEASLLYNCVAYSHDHSKKMSLVTMEHPFLFPGRSPASVRRHNGITASCFDEVAGNGVFSFVDQKAWCVETCLDLDEAITIYDRSSEE